MHTERGIPRVETPARIETHDRLRLKDPRAIRVSGCATSAAKSITQLIADLNSRFGPPDGFPRTNATIKYMLEEVRQGFLFVVRFGRLRLAVVGVNRQYVCPFALDEAGKSAGLEDGEQFEFGGSVPMNRLWANHYILCTDEQPGGFGVAMLEEYISLFDELAGQIPDCDYFLNRRDCPWVRADGQHCYAFASKGCRTVHTQQLAPVLSLYQGAAWRDLPLVEPAPPSRTQGCKWERKVEVALFRGTYTGGTPLRLELVRLALAHPTLIDAGITSRPHRIKMVDDKVIFPAPLHPKEMREPIPMGRWGEHKYIIYVSGYSAALRMGPMLGMGSVVIKLVESKPLQDAADELWFFDQLKAWRFPAEMKDLIEYDHVEVELDSIVDAVSFLRNNDSIARTLANNALKAFDRISNRAERARFQLAVLREAKSASL
tara:strand:- start:1695 stop:2990 length:1296 start_codon:yes stop_codon:yes gene_type:complete